jgi:hypothetical protein
MLGGTRPQIESLRADPRWQRRWAVSTGRASVNPNGVFQWDRYGPEEARQFGGPLACCIRTCSRTCYGRHHSASYQDFFGYSLTDADVHDLLQPRTQTGTRVELVGVGDIDGPRWLASSDKANCLPGYTFTTSAARVERLADGIEVGNLSINHFAASIAETPFGGVKERGYGREGGVERFE